MSGEVLGASAAAATAVAAPALPPPLLPPPPPPPLPPRTLFAIAAVASRLPRSSSSSSSSSSPSDAVRVVPLSRWDADDGWFDRGGGGVATTTATGAPPPPLPKRFGAFVEGAALFDARSFSLSSAEAAALDPQQRLLLECGAEALGKAPGMDGRQKRERERSDSFFFFNDRVAPLPTLNKNLVLSFFPPSLSYHLDLRAFSPNTKKLEKNGSQNKQTPPPSPSPSASATQSTTSTPRTRASSRRCRRPRARSRPQRAGSRSPWG